MAMEIAVRGLFATPVAAVVLPGAEARNARLQAMILERRRHRGSIRSSNAGGSARDECGRHAEMADGPQPARRLLEGGLLKTWAATPRPKQG